MAAQTQMKAASRKTASTTEAAELEARQQGIARLFEEFLDSVSPSPSVETRYTQAEAQTASQTETKKAA